MGELSRITDFASALPGELARAQQRGIRAGALAVTRSIRAETAQATGGDSRLSGVGRRGARVGARYDVKGVTNPTALIRATGPFQLIEHDTSAHPIRPRRRRRGGRLRLADGSFRAGVRHPGTRAKRPFARGVTRAQSEPGKALDRAVQDAIKRSLA